MYYTIKVAGVERDLPLYPVGDNLQIAAFVMLGDVTLTKSCAGALIAKAPPHDILITAETKGIPLAYEMAAQLGHEHHIILRKSQKLYMPRVLAAEVESITTANHQTLYLDESDAKLLKGKRVLIVDDVISTGSSLRAIEWLVRDAGGIIAAKMAVLAEGDAQNRDDIIYLERLPLFDGAGAVKSL